MAAYLDSRRHYESATLGHLAYSQNALPHVGVLVYLDRCKRADTACLCWMPYANWIDSL